MSSNIPSQYSSVREIAREELEAMLESVRAELNARFAGRLAAGDTVAAYIVRGTIRMSVTRKQTGRPN